MPDPFARTPKGERLAVIRPDPEHADLAVSMALRALALQGTDPAKAQALYEAIPAEIEKAGGQYTCMGFLGRDGSILDTDGKVKTETQEPGDSYVNEGGITTEAPT